MFPVQGGTPRVGNWPTACHPYRPHLATRLLLHLLRSTLLKTYRVRATCAPIRRSLQESPYQVIHFAHSCIIVLEHIRLVSHAGQTRHGNWVGCVFSSTTVYHVSASKNLCDTGIPEQRESEPCRAYSTIEPSHAVTLPIQHSKGMSTCAKCYLHFRSREVLLDHYRTSKVHPKCSYCGTGVLGDFELKAVSESFLY